MNNKQKIVFMGTPEYATVIFEKLLEEDYNIVALFTQPDKKVGRKQVLTPPHIKQFCLENGLSLPIYQPKSLKEISNIDVLKDLNPDFIIVAAYGQILSQEILNIAPCINLHASLLPLYRGASPIQSAILNDDKYTGVTSMMMEKGLDSGDILGFKYMEIKQDMNVGDLFEQLSHIAAVLTIDTITNFDRIIPKQQNNANVSHCSKIQKSDGEVEFTNAKDLYQEFKAYKFWPGIFLESQLKIKECKLIENNSTNKSSEILEINSDYIVVGCTIGTIQISQVQPASKKSMNATDYIRGSRLQVGDIFI